MAKEELKKQRLLFDSNGKIIGADGREFNQEETKKFNHLQSPKGFDYKKYYSHKKPSNIKLKTSENLDFLKDESTSTSVGNIFEKTYWNLNESGNRDVAIPPLKFSNKKTQEDVVKEIVELIEKGKKVIFLHGVCGSGKSAIALNVARSLNKKSSIVVPLKSLQKQYETDYLGKKYLTKLDGSKMKIAMITGKDNHDSIIQPGVACSNPELPENIKITDRNYGKLIDYYRDNPLIENKDSEPNLENIRRLSIAPANPYWSPILPAEFEVQQFKDVKKYKYRGVNGKDFIFYHRKHGCSYYDQYLSYFKADVIIYNSAKFKSELSIGRKPETDVDIIDEADDFLDSLFQQEELNLTMLTASLKILSPDKIETKNDIKQILELIDLEEKNKRILGIDESQVFHINETKLTSILQLFIKNPELESLITVDELNYSNKALETAYNLKNLLDEVYLTYKKDEENLYVRLVSTNLSAKFKDILEKSKALIFMSGTLHNEKILNDLFKVKDYEIVEAETTNFGNIEISLTGKEFDCKYSNFKSKMHSREDYLKTLSLCVEKSVHPTLIHVHAFQDLPTDEEKQKYELLNIMSSEKLKKLQYEDKIGKMVGVFKAGMASTLFSTKCSRGIDFPGDMCKSIIFTKYPNPNVSDTFWKVLMKTHPNQYWEFYKDKANREFLQRIYRALRSKDDHVFILSPDIRVINAVRGLQRNGNKTS